ncbi:MAG: aminotransferase class I/II-fold pyridoxal phosphate-dependent enzyme [Turneriella sp.]|nr:aminotransferase class I/II-fold pyridoxal phosphate-dependent enzyme [Turneriella sp.]
MSTPQIQIDQYDQEHIHKTLADFILQRREQPDLFAWCKPFYESVQYQYSIGHHKYRRVMLSANGNRVIVEDQHTGKPREMIMMGSNSYLGLNNHPKVKAAALEAIEKYGVGAGSPPHFSGYYDLHRELEKNLSILKGAEDTIIYPSGYATNVGIISCFLGPKDTIILDKLAHASIIDGALLSGAKITTFRHNDMDSLERVLIQTKKGQGDRLVVVEGVYSMDGDIAPLRDIYELVKKHGAKLMVDEAHATGVLGKTGKGSPEHFGLEGKIDLVMGTFSKSLGGLGGFVSAKKEVVCYLRYFSRAYFFAASPTPVQVAAQNAAVQVLMTEPQWHQKLWENIRYFHSELRKRRFDIERTQTAITPIVIGDTIKMREVTKFLDEKGIFVNPVPYPAVPRKKDRLRLSLSALHTREDLDTVLAALDEAEERFHFAKADEEESKEH